jgi:hypothetical protein
MDFPIKPYFAVGLASGVFCSSPLLEDFSFAPCNEFVSSSLDKKSVPMAESNIERF